MITGKRILITGGNGFLGTHVVKRLQKDNKVSSLGNFLT